MAPTDDSPSTIDSLLERYLSLLDEYTKLRTALNALQSGIYHDIARANFAAERGIRFGQDYYDARMHASRKVEIRLGDGSGEPSHQQQQHPVFAVISCVDKCRASEAGETEAETEGEQNPAHSDADQQHPSDKPKQKPSSDPLRWFGGALSTPMPLRQAQSQAVQAVEDIIPRLATVNAAMAAVEVEVRRARKKRAKAEAAVAAKVQQEGVQDGHGKGAVAVL
ncbi:hypothetical protein B0T22DRAFT_291037 [Podospora appendiculata]|uniref:Vacuolar ATPase assembly protein VMA22 n=1 Tax=Podospora appendiculata TaxID=314037 RepID=A0AAE1C8A4_9PEZI|nr:hypothetical protein B0T22DRAFT_291037 [Podospora appendiculata]